MFREVMNRLINNVVRTAHVTDPLVISARIL
jgi:hypothetical protein